MSQTRMKIAIASDHAAVGLKAELATSCAMKGHEVSDLGPDRRPRRLPRLRLQAGRGHRRARRLWRGAVRQRHRHFHRGQPPSRARCALVSEPLSAALAREHNNANVIAMGARLTGIDMAKACLTAFLNGQFGGAATPAASKSSPTPPSDPAKGPDP
jgi:ribose 5-phosphate isomerase B